LDKRLTYRLLRCASFVFVRQDKEVIWYPPYFRCEMTEIYFLTNASQTEEPLTTLTAGCERSFVLYVNPQMKLLPSTLHKAKRPLKNLTTTTTTTTTTIRLSTDTLVANVH